MRKFIVALFIVFIVIMPCFGRTEQGFYTGFEIPIARISGLPDNAIVSSPSIVGISLTYQADFYITPHTFLSVGAGFRSYGIETFVTIESSDFRNELKFSDFIFPVMYNSRILEGLYAQAGGILAIRMNTRNKYGHDIGDYYKSIYPTVHVGLKYFLTDAVYGSVMYGHSVSDLHTDESILHLGIISMGVGVRL